MKKIRNRCVIKFCILWLLACMLLIGCGAAAAYPETGAIIVETQETKGTQETKKIKTQETSQIQETQETQESQEVQETQDVKVPELYFRNERLLREHYEKHGIDMGFSSMEAYEEAAALVTVHPEVLHKKEKEDGDDVYYVESTNEFVIVSTDGYLRTYFYPNRGIDYYNRQ